MIKIIPRENACADARADDDDVKQPNNRTNERFQGRIKRSKDTAGRQTNIEKRFFLTTCRTSFIAPLNTKKIPTQLIICKFYI